MRRVEEEGAWHAIRSKRQALPASPLSIGRVELNKATPCLVIGGRHGAGKSRLLRSLGKELAGDGLIIDLHHLCEQALIVLRSRDDFDAMKEEFGPSGPDDDRRNDVERIVGREYESVAWYALEVEPSDPEVAERFRWGGEQALIPYFEVTSRGRDYTSREMGLGEFAVHFLFWILEQYREAKNLTLLLDEPDAYLPPIGASWLLARLLKICLKRDWSLMITTHSSEMIGQAVEEDAFVLLSTGDDGEPTAAYSVDDPTIADRLLATPPIRNVFFVEDESASTLLRVLLEAYDKRVSASTEIVWGKGSGYMVGLQQHLPRAPNGAIRMALVFDGDKRIEVQESTSKQWPALFLPTEGDPDDLFKTARGDVAGFASRISVPVGELSRFVDSLEAHDPHDWVNDLGDRYGRQRVLRALAELWAARNQDEVAAFSDLLGKSI